MARIAIAVAGGIIGAFFGAPQIGFALGSLLGGVLFPPKLPTNYGPRLNDKQIMSGAEGEPIPWGYGGFRIAGNVIWAMPMKEITTKTSQSAKGGPSQTSITYTYVASFAVAFCEGPATITRIWADSKLIYDVTGKGAVAIGTGITNNGQAQTTRIAPLVYPGDALQMPDPSIQADKGIPNTPAFRGLCYVVFNEFPLADFGNRIPNIRAEVSSGTLLQYVKDTYPSVGIPDQQDGGVRTAEPVYVNATQRLAYIFDQQGESVEVIDLNADATQPVNPWVATTAMAVGDQRLDSNGQVETVVSLGGDHKTGGTAPTWTSGGFGVITIDHNVTWMNVGPGPNAVVVLRKGAFNAALGTAQPDSLSFNRFLPYAGGVDTAGYIWGTAVYSLAGQFHDYAIRFDPITFNLVSAIHLGINSGSNSLPANMNFVKIGDTDFVYFTNRSAGGDLFIADVRQSNFKRIGWEPAGYAFAGPGLGGWPTVDPSTGDAYLIAWGAAGQVHITDVEISGSNAIYTYSGLDHGNLPIVGQNGVGEIIQFQFCGTGNNVTARMTAITSDFGGGGTITVPLTTQIAGPTSDPASSGNSTGGAFTLTRVTRDGAVQSFFYVGDSTLGKGEACLFDTSDNSVIIFSGRDGGGTYGTDSTIWKVDSRTGNVLATTSGTTHFRNGDMIAHAYNGVVPSDGIIRVIDKSATAFNYFSASDLSLVKSVLLNNWFNLGSSFAPVDMSYDAATNSMILTGGAYTGLAFRVFLDRQAVSAATLDTIVTDLLQRADVPAGQIDVSDLAATTCLGYCITRTSDAKSCIQPLCLAYFFDIVETDFKLKGVRRGGAAVINVPEDDLGLASDQYKLAETIAQEQDLPKTVSVQYYDPALNYQQAKQHHYRRGRVKKTKNQSVLQLPITLTADEAAQIANKYLSMVWGERNQYAKKLWRAAYLVLDPTDVMQFTYEGLPFQARISKETLGQNKVLEISGVSEDARQYLSTTSGATAIGFQVGSIIIAGPTLTFLLDIPLLQDTDASPSGNSGLYYAMSSPTPGWAGGILKSSPDNIGYVALDTDLDEAVYGVVALPTPAPFSPFSWDFVTTITVRLAKGTLSSTTMLSVLNGANGFILGGEVMQFVTATLNVDGTYTLSGLLRGRRGTEFACKEHAGGETFISLNAATMHHVALPTNLVGLLRYYKGVTLGNLDTSVSPTQLTLSANDLKPYAPAQFTGSADGSGNINMSWVRRTRVGGAWLDGAGTVPLSEQAESYDLDIMHLNFQGRDDLHYAALPAREICQQQLFNVSPGTYAYKTIIAPFTLTWDDGVTANYQGGVFSLTSTLLANASPTFIWVHDPSRTGDVNNGLTVTYGADAPTHADDTQANTSGYFLIGVLPAFLVGQADAYYITGAGGDSAVRTLTGLNTPTFTYTAAQQVIDFGRNEITAIGAPGFVRARVFQNSAVVGRGFATDNATIGAGNTVSGGSDASSILGVPITGTPVDGDIMQYNASADEWQIVGPVLKRKTVAKTTASLANGVAETGTWSVGCKAFALLQVEVSAGARVELYSTAALRDADSVRAYNTPPVAGTQNGILADLGLISGGDETWVCSTPLLCANADVSASAQVYYRITNLSGSTGAITATLTILPIEV